MIGPGSLPAPEKVNVMRPVVDAPIGTLVALCVPIAGGINWTVTQRSHAQGQGVDLVPAVLVGAVISSLVTLPLAEMGAIIAPPVPALYARPESVDALIERLPLGCEHGLFGEPGCDRRSRRASGHTTAGRASRAR